MNSDKNNNFIELDLSWMRFVYYILQVLGIGLSAYVFMSTEAKLNGVGFFLDKIIIYLKILVVLIIVHVLLETYNKDCGFETIEIKTLRVENRISKKNALIMLSLLLGSILSPLGGYLIGILTIGSIYNLLAG